MSWQHSIKKTNEQYYLSLTHSSYPSLSLSLFLSFSLSLPLPLSLSLRQNNQKDWWAIFAELFHNFTALFHLHHNTTWQHMNTRFQSTVLNYIPSRKSWAHSFRQLHTESPMMPDDKCSPPAWLEAVDNKGVHTEVCWLCCKVHEAWRHFDYRMLSTGKQGTHTHTHWCCHGHQWPAAYNANTYAPAFHGKVCFYNFSHKLYRELT